MTTTFITKIWPLGILIFLGLMSCSEKDTPTPITGPNNPTLEELNESSILGDWTIADFIEDNDDYPELEGLTLRLKENGDLLVIDPQNQDQKRGTWRLWLDDGKTEFAIKLNQAGKWYELNDDWYFISQNDNQIRFEDPSSPSLLIIQRIP